MVINELLEKIESVEKQDLKLFFITRYLKENMRKSSRVLDKYLFKVYQVDIDDEIREHLYALTEHQLKSVIKKKLDIIEYDVVSDDTHNLFTYSMKNKAISFSDVVNNQLKEMVPRVMSIEKILSSKEELWAYCVGFNDIEYNDWVYTFRKIQPSKVAIDENENHNKKLKAIRTVFNTENQKLELLEGETINLDKQIDCIYYEDIFYILKKGFFEQIIGLQEEYKEEAKSVYAELKKIDLIDGLEIIEKQIEEKPAIHKKLVLISKIGNYRTIDEKTIKKMQKVCRKYGVKLNVEEGHLQIKEPDDVDTILKILADYYKTGEVSGKSYGTYAGKQLKPEN